MTRNQLPNSQEQNKCTWKDTQVYVYQTHKHAPNWGNLFGSLNAKAFSAQSG